MLATLSTPPKPKEKRKRETPLYFKARRSVIIRTDSPQPPSKEPIIIVDTPTIPRDTSPSKAYITYEQGSPKKSSWTARMDKLNSEASVRDAKTVL